MMNQIPGKPRRFWTPGTTSAIAVGSIPYAGPGSYLPFGYKYGKLKGQTPARAAGEAAKWEGAARAASVIGSTAALGLFAPRLLGKAWQASKGLPTVRRVTRTLGSFGLPKVGVRNLYRQGGWKSAVHGVFTAVRKHPLLPALAVQEAGGWAGYGTVAPFAAHRWKQAKQRSQAYWDKMPTR